MLHTALPLPRPFSVQLQENNQEQRQKLLWLGSLRLSPGRAALLDAIIHMARLCCCCEVRDAWPRRGVDLIAALVADVSWKPINCTDFFVQRSTISSQYRQWSVEGKARVLGFSVPGNEVGI